IIPFRYAADILAFGALFDLITPYCCKATFFCRRSADRADYSIGAAERRTYGSVTMLLPFWVLLCHIVPARPAHTIGEVLLL
ncbi:MAG: hypothetical protein M3014_04735, partial [Chloroflexota bacterium]|nr:hypothetical protein [Chloroflexota bacterium]